MARYSKREVQKTHKRRIAELRKIAAFSLYRHDSQTEWPSIDEDLRYEDGHFASKSSAPFSKAGERAYVLNILLSDDLIRLIGIDHEIDSDGQAIAQGHAIKITLKGLEYLRENDRSWWSKAIEKQPMTFLQVVFLVFNLVLSAWNAFLFSQT